MLTDIEDGRLGSLSSSEEDEDEVVVEELDEIVGLRTEFRVTPSKVRGPQSTIQGLGTRYGDEG